MNDHPRPFSFYLRTKTRWALRRKAKIQSAIFSIPERTMWRAPAQARSMGARIQGQTAAPARRNPPRIARSPATRKICCQAKKPAVSPNASPREYPNCCRRTIGLDFHIGPNSFPLKSSESMDGMRAQTSFFLSATTTGKIEFWEFPNSFSLHSCQRWSTAATDMNR